MTKKWREETQVGVISESECTPTDDDDDDGGDEG